MRTRKQIDDNERTSTHSKRARNGTIRVLRTEFKRKMKIEAAKRDMTMADLMREMAKEQEEVKKLRRNDEFFNL